MRAIVGGLGCLGSLVVLGGALIVAVTILTAPWYGQMSSCTPRPPGGPSVPAPQHGWCSEGFMARIAVQGEVFSFPRRQPVASQAITILHWITVGAAVLAAVAALGAFLGRRSSRSALLVAIAAAGISLLAIPIIAWSSGYPMNAMMTMLSGFDVRTDSSYTPYTGPDPLLFVLGCGIAGVVLLGGAAWLAGARARPRSSA